MAGMCSRRLGHRGSFGSRPLPGSQPSSCAAPRDSCLHEIGVGPVAIQCVRYNWALVALNIRRAKTAIGNLLGFVRNRPAFGDVSIGDRRQPRPLARFGCCEPKRARLESICRDRIWADPCATFTCGFRSCEKIALLANCFSPGGLWFLALCLSSRKRKR